MARPWGERDRGQHWLAAEGRSLADHVAGLARPASVHWRYDPAAVQSLLPAGFRVDPFDDAAWVGLIPFHMRRIRLAGLPSLGPFSTFPETNVRTYIVDAAGRRAVWFASLDVTGLRCSSSLKR